MSDRAERERIAQAAAGSRPAVERLLLDHYTPLVQHLRPLIPVSAQSVLSVEDILQETFSQAFQDIRTFTPATDKSFGTWLKAIAENRLLDAIKALKRKKRGGGQLRVQPPAYADEDASGGFRHGGWHLRYFDERWMSWVVDNTLAASEATSTGALLTTFVRTETGSTEAQRLPRPPR